MNRREFLSLSLGSALLSTFNSTQLQKADPHGSSPFFSTETFAIERHTLRYRDLPVDLEGFRIGLVSDFHLGGWVKNSLVTEAMEILKNEKVSCVIHGGDYLWVPDTFGKGAFDTIINDSFTGSNDEEVGESIYDTIATILKRYQFSYGSYGVLGNHDRWSNDSACYEYLPKGGVVLLENKVARIAVNKAVIEIFGSADYWTGIPELPTFSKDQSTFKIFVTHNPDFASYAYHKKGASFHLALSGHTHGGQIKLPFIGALTYNIDDPRYGEGLVDYGESKFYTTRGVGVVEVPIRILCPPEITVLTLESSSSK